MCIRDRLKDFGAGIEVTLLAAIPAGSGLGTSSILASTVLGAINDFCGLAWDKNEICQRTLVLEQLLDVYKRQVFVCVKPSDELEIE